ncbi:MAG: hypothetical protein EP297_04070 [Gammaproteobacteria bacterium]|nr:MAG: hypothetical protein EP297_04070 [Gammaproteobacteria bacterium]
MKFSLDNGTGTYRIIAHRPGSIQVNEMVVDYPVIIMPEQMMQWEAQDFDSLQPHHFHQLIELNPEILLFGSGATQRFPMPELYRSVLEAGIGMEVMDTAAACRTYNILMAEDRQVAAVLFMTEL